MVLAQPPLLLTGPEWEASRLNTGWNQEGALTLPSSPELGRHRGEQESMEANRARKSESPAGPGYADIPSLEWLRKCAGESWLIT